MRTIKVWLLVSLLLSLELLADRGLISEYQKKHGGEKKIALVIGNSNYSGKLSHLKNPTNDARDIKSALSSKGFEVIFTTNADLEEMERKIDKFIHKLKSAKVGFFYFAGHGLEVKKKNYIIPIGANISNEYKVKSRTVSVDEVVERMGDSGVRLSMVVLDACRNDPFHRGGGGLAPKEAHGTLIAYATAPGDVASDGDGDNGLYTKHLLKSLNTPNLKHTEIFRQTRTGVYSESAGKQRPYVSDGTIGVFYFNITDTPTYQKPKPQGNSSFQFNSNKPTLYSLTVHTTPSNARVYITNIIPKYKDGILLERGKYKLKIKAKGYYTKKGTVELKSDLSISVALDKKPVTKAPKPTYSSKDTWRDSSTGLMWQVPIDSKKYNWSDAKRYCRDLTLGGYSDWRLPSRDELKSIMRKKSYSNAKSYSGKTYIKKPLLKSMDMEYQFFWSSTEKDTGWFEDESAWIVFFHNGLGSYFGMSLRSFVRCVRQ
jgi:hypothetical protein